METKKITILGYSDAYITMIFDFLRGYEFEILDNLNLYNESRISNSEVDYRVVKDYLN